MLLAIAVAPRWGQREPTPRIVASEPIWPRLVPPPLLAPAAVMAFEPEASERVLRPDGSEFTLRYSRVVLEPAWLDLEFSSGWEHEPRANTDSSALLFFTGPTYERQPRRNELGIALHGDLLLANGEWRAGNQAAARQRAFMAITHAGELQFGYGRLTPQNRHQYRLFVGGLHALTNTVLASPASYSGVYERLSMADVRILYAWRPDERLELIETADGVHAQDLLAFAAQRRFKAVYLPDHASKSRFIVPGRKLWSEEQALWVSGGDLSITPLPFMLKAVPTTAWQEARP